MRSKHLAEFGRLLGALRQEAKENGLDKISIRQIDAEVAAARKARARKKHSKATCRMMRVVFDTNVLYSAILKLPAFLRTSLPLSPMASSSPAYRRHPGGISGRVVSARTQTPRWPQARNAQSLFRALPPCDSAKRLRSAPTSPTIDFLNAPSKRAQPMLSPETCAIFRADMTTSRSSLPRATRSPALEREEPQRSPPPCLRNLRTSRSAEASDHLATIHVLGCNKGNRHPATATGEIPSRGGTNEIAW